ncbi:hypothetical protein HPB48_009635 [Haemaphysalis longicornis]|uniref:exodeoxyribonuclease III n=1 Tax=Haemaphysalis longicornis TaxID=44386 RepID=A0A9J6GB41_HAELO|nr:hypothetical protein HPB48_009635 [Haemaphysalis longicornis]
MRCSSHYLHCTTLNVRGLSERKRQSQLYRLISERQLDVVAFQETKVETEQSTERMVRVFSSSYEVYVSHAVGLSEGCLILIRRSSGAVLQNVTSNLSGRFVICDFILASKKWRIVYVYAPTKADERKVFFEELQARLGTERVVVLMGDFNFVCSARDKSTCTPYRDGSTIALNGIAADFGLEDVGMRWDGRRRCSSPTFKARAT